VLTISVRFNNDLTVDQFVRMAVLAEELAFDQVWISNDLFWRSSPVLLAAAAKATTSIALGAAVMNPVSMHPSEIAMAAASLDELSGGRFLLGIGAGADEFLDWARLDGGPALKRTRRALIELRALLSGQAPPGWRPEGHLRTGPSRVRIYVGAMGPQMLGMAGELADGALPLLFPPEHFPVAHQQVLEGVQLAGRDPLLVDIAACVWCSIDDDVAAAQRALAAKIAYYGASFSPYLLTRMSLSLEDFRPVQRAMSDGDPAGATDLITPRMLGLGIAGNPRDVTDRCVRLVDAGARHISFGPPLGPKPELALACLAREVVPALQARSVD
jgi:5,10-methylenetetrahydromethanopterin reductase